MFFQNNNIIDINCTALHVGHCIKWMGLMCGCQLLWYCILYLIYGEFVFCICMMFLIVLGPSAKLNGFNQDKSVWTAAIVILPLLEEVPRPPQTLLYFSQTVLYFSTFSLLCITFVFSLVLLQHFAWWQHYKTDFIVQQVHRVNWSGGWFLFLCEALLCSHWSTSLFTLRSWLVTKMFTLCALNVQCSHWDGVM